MSWVGERIASFGDAFRGIRGLVADEANARIHALATSLLIVFAWGLDVSASDWALLTLAMALVWAAEAFNTAIETLADRISPDRDGTIRRAKDLAAGGVLLAAIGAAAVGLIVLAPPLWSALAG